jgi:transposase
LICDSLPLLIRQGIVMGRAYSQDLRERVMAAVESGTGAYVVASDFQVSVSYIYKALGRRRTTGETSARRWAGGPKPKLAAHDEAVRDRVMRNPDATLAELQAWLIEERGTKVSVGCLWKRLQRLGLTLKKKHCTPPNKTAPMSPRRARSGVRASPI